MSIGKQRNLRGKVREIELFLPPVWNYRKINIVKENCGIPLAWQFDWDTERQNGCVHSLGESKNKRTNKREICFSQSWIIKMGNEWEEIV